MAVSHRAQDWRIQKADDGIHMLMIKGVLEVGILLPWVLLFHGS